MLFNCFFLNLSTITHLTLIVILRNYSLDSSNVWYFLAIPPPDPFKSARSKTGNVQQINYQEPSSSNTLKNAPLDITFQKKNAQPSTNTLEKTLPSTTLNKQVGSASPWNVPETVQNNLNAWSGPNMIPTTTSSPPTVTSAPQIATTGTVKIFLKSTHILVFLSVNFSYCK